MTRPEAIAEVRRLMAAAGITLDELRAEMQQRLDLGLEPQMEKPDCANSRASV